MIKTISMLTRKAGTTHEQFMKHWVEIHAPLAHAVPGIRRYVQSHILEERKRADIPSTDVDVDGVAELWYDDRESMLKSAATPQAKALYADGALFIGRIKSFIVDEYVVIPRAARPLAFVTVGLILAAVASCTTAQPVTTLADGQTGTIGFESRTPTIGQFLQGGSGGTPAAISGELELPRGATGRVPAMVIVHGAGGISEGETQWARNILRIGVATFVIDSFSGRGLREAQTGQTELPTVVSILDAYRALALLASHPRIDPGRIGILGLSRGGMVSLYASLRRFQRMHALSGREFGLYVAFYPSCNTRYVEDEDVSDRPIRIFHGEADNQALFARCRDYVARLRQAGKNVAIIGYPGAHHSFDNPRAGTDSTTRNFSQCAFDESKPPADLRAYVSSCVSRGVTRAYEPRAHADAVKRVTALVRETFAVGR